MLDLAWTRKVLEMEGLGSRRIVVQGITPHNGAVSDETGEIVLWERWEHGEVLHEVAHAVAGTRDQHTQGWQIVYARLIDTYTVPVCIGALGLEG